MPTIQKLPKRERTPKNNTARRDIRRKAYADSRWCGKNGVRNAYFAWHPLCEECLKKGIVKAGENVHHKKSPFNGEDVDWNLMLDYNNLETVCRECHADIHTKEDGKTTARQMIEILDYLFGDEDW